MTIDFNCNNKAHLDMCGSTVKLDGTKVTVNGEFVETFEANTKQDVLVSGTNIKTINGKSILGKGNIKIDVSGVEVISSSTDTVYNLPNLTAEAFNTILNNDDKSILLTWDDNNSIQTGTASGITTNISSLDSGDIILDDTLESLPVEGVFYNLDGNTIRPDTLHGYNSFYYVGFGISNGMNHWINFKNDPTLAPLLDKIALVDKDGNNQLVAVETCGHGLAVNRIGYTQRTAQPGDLLILKAGFKWAGLELKRTIGFKIVDGIVNPQTPSDFIGKAIVGVGTVSFPCGDGAIAVYTAELEENPKTGLMFTQVKPKLTISKGDNYDSDIALINSKLQELSEEVAEGIDEYKITPDGYDNVVTETGETISFPVLSYDSVLNLLKSNKSLSHIYVYKSTNVTQGTPFGDTIKSYQIVDREYIQESNQISFVVTTKGYISIIYQGYLLTYSIISVSSMYGPNTPPTITRTYKALGSSGNGTVVTVDGTAVETFDADTKLDKKEPTFTNTVNPTALVYGTVNPDYVTNGNAPTQIDGMISASLFNEKNTIVLRDSAKHIRQDPAFLQSIRGNGIGYSFTDKDYNSLIGVPVILIGINGTITAADYSALLSSPVLTISLDNELYHRISNLGGVLVYQTINNNVEKILTINNDYTWVLTVNEDTKLDKENPTFASDNYGCYVYGVVTSNSTDHKPTTVDGMIPSTYLSTSKTIVQRDNTGRIRQSPMNGDIALDGNGYSFTDKDFNGLIRTFITLTSGSSSGTLTKTQYMRLNYSPALMISLDNELYTKVIDDTTSQVWIYQHISNNTIKTITINGDYTWELTTAPIAEGGDPITVDTEFSETSENPVQNKVITEKINEIDNNISMLQNIIILDEEDVE